MSSSLTRHLSVAAASAFALLLAVLTAAPASAGSFYFSKSSGTTASATWLEVGTLPGGVPGNIHFGSLVIEDLGGGSANVWGEVYDLTCEPGVIPDGPGGGHGEEPTAPEGCVHEGARFIEGGDVVFEMDRKLSSATLTGTLQVWGHDGPSGAPAVNMTLTGFGDLYKSVEGGTFTDSSGTYSYRYNFSGRSATVSGNIGAMVFDDVAGEWSEAQMGSYRSMDRGRTR